MIERITAIGVIDGGRSDIGGKMPGMTEKIKRMKEDMDITLDL